MNSTAIMKKYWKNSKQWFCLYVISYLFMRLSLFIFGIDKKCHIPHLTLRLQLLILDFIVTRIYLNRNVFRENCLNTFSNLNTYISKNSISLKTAFLHFLSFIFLFSKYFSDSNYTWLIQRGQSIKKWCFYDTQFHIFVQCFKTKLSSHFLLHFW